MSLIVSNRSKEKYLVPNPAITGIKNEQLGFQTMLGILRDKKLGEKEHKGARDLFPLPTAVKS